MKRINTNEKRVRENVGAIHELPLLKKVIKSHSRFYLSFSSVLLIVWLGLFLLIHLVGISRNEVLEHLPIFCPFKALTGILCPGCGMTRAFLAIAEADFVGAFHFNPFSIPLFAFFVLSAFKIPLPIPQRVNNYLPTFMFIVIILWWFWTRLVPGVFI
ncbi:MAG: DUF2752 domain-containing protein [Deltaproteobacteria bacterium]|nr:DUF2752 domain-containing protein [Deltaproteobacteria bacterium]